MSLPIINFRPSGDQEWARSAACGDPTAPDMFPHEADVKGIQRAKFACGGCEVRDACLSEALDRGESHGVWGGLTTAERRELNRREYRKGKRNAPK